MSEELTSVPFQSLFANVQDYIVDILKENYELSAWKVPVLAEHVLDIEYQIKNNLGKQGIVAVVNTLNGQYQGHDNVVQAWTFGCEVDIVENPTIRRAELKKSNLSVGTTTDVAYLVEEIVGGPQYGHFGEFCPATIEIGENQGLVVGKAKFNCLFRNDISGIISSDGNRRFYIPWVTSADMSAYVDSKLSSISLSAYYTKDESDERFMEKTPSEIQLYSSSAPYPIFISQNNDGNLVFNDNPYSTGSMLKPDDTPVMTSAQMSAYCKTTEADNRYLLIDNKSKVSNISCNTLQIYDSAGDVFLSPNGGQIGFSYSGRSFGIDTSGCQWANTSRNYTNKFSFGTLSGTHTFKFQPIAAGTNTSNVAMQEWVARDYLPKTNGTAVNLTLSSTDTSNIQIQAGHGGFDFSTDGQTWHSASLPNEDGTLATQNYVDTQTSDLLPKSNGTAIGLKLVGDDAASMSAWISYGGIAHDDGAGTITNDLPLSSGTLATEDYVQAQIGSINTILEALN